MRAFRLFPPARLPVGFRYPEGLLRLAAGAPHRRLHPWHFLDAEGELALLARLLASEDGRALVPFACLGQRRGEIACFDGSSPSVDPAVRMLMAPAQGAPAFAGFAAWLAAATADAERWRRQARLGAASACWRHRGR